MNEVTQMAFEGLAKFTIEVKDQLIEHIMKESARAEDEANPNGEENADKLNGKG